MRDTFWPPGAAMAPTLQLTGSTTLLPRMQRAAEAYMETHAGHIVINGGCGTARGYKALLDGTTDIAMASGTAANDVAAAAATRGLALRETVVARDAILVLVHPSNPVATLSLQALRNLFTGRIDNWRQLGGVDAPVEVLAGAPGGGVSAWWRSAVLGADDTMTPAARVLDAEARLARVAARPHAITYMAQMPMAAPRLKVLRIDGIAPAWAPAYPLQAPMMLVTLGGAMPAAAQFIAFAASRHTGTDTTDAYDE